jgi:hypothetical protein
MSTWAVVIPDDRYESERLFQHDVLELTGLELTGLESGGLESGGLEMAAPGRVSRPAPGDEVLVVAGAEPPVVVALGRVTPSTGVGADPDDPQADPGRPLVVRYTRRAFDAPAPVDRLDLTGPVTPVDPATFRELAGRVNPTADRQTYLVSLDLPIEASSRAEAVRLFWSYVMELGPRELPTFVWPSGDELDMRTFVLGVEANQDPEGDDD